MYFTIVPVSPLEFTLARVTVIMIGSANTATTYVYQHLATCPQRILYVYVTSSKVAMHIL